MQQQLHTSNTWPTRIRRRTASTIRERKKKTLLEEKKSSSSRQHSNPNEGKDGEMGS
jgi:hypothetical protein